MATTFNMLRANDLIWSFVVNNYLLGKDPFPFDLLYWNSDSTRMPAAMHSFYLRNMYQRTSSFSPAASRSRARRSTSRKIKTPAYILSTREDHIAPWHSTYAATQLYQGPVRFVLGGLRPHRRRRQPAGGQQIQLLDATNKCPPDAQTWLASAKENPGSWWPDWAKWIAKSGGARIPARKPGDGKLKPIEDAPGSYVKVRIQ